MGNILTASSLLLNILLAAWAIAQARRTKQEKSAERLAAMEAELLVLRTQMDVFWKGVSYSAAQALHSPHTPELDSLLEAFQANELEQADIPRFLRILQEVAGDSQEDTARRKWAGDIATLVQVRYKLGEGS